MISPSRRHAVTLLGLFASVVAAVGSACGSDPTPGRTSDTPGDASVIVDGALTDSVPAPDSTADTQTAADAPVDDDATDDVSMDVVNPYTDAFETYDAAADTMITTENDTGTLHDSSAPPLDGDMTLHD